MTRPDRIIQVAIVLFSCCRNGAAQHIDHTSSFRHINQSPLLRLHYENDFFTRSDRYYSQGFTAEYVHPRLKKIFPAKWLWTPAATTPSYGISLNLFGYTPSRITSDAILYGDRPYDANITLKFFAIQPDPEWRLQVVSSLSIGMMGPAALGREIQTGIHNLTKDPLPEGWQHQIKNDIILNYQLGYEKKLAGNNRNFLLNTAAEAKLGTLNCQLDAGVNFMAGRFNKRFAAIPNPSRKAEYYFFGQGRVRLVGYNAALQGGILNRSSVYTIPAAAISRGVFQADAGFIVTLKKYILSYTQSFITKEFRTGSTHRWGGVTLGFLL